MGRHVKKLLRTLPKYADNNGFNLEQSYSKIAVYTLHPSVNANKLLSELVAEDGVALDAFEVGSIREAYDDFLSRREDRKYDPVFFCAAEKDWQSAGVLACCLDISWDEPGRVGLTRCPEVAEVCMIPAKMSAGRAQASRGLDNARGSASANWQGGNASAGYSSSSASAMSWSEIVYEEDYEEWSETIYEESYEEVDVEEDESEEEVAEVDEEEAEDDEEEAEDEEKAAEDEEVAAEDEEETVEDEDEAAEDEEEEAEDEDAEDDAEEDEDEAEDDEEAGDNAQEDDDEAEAEDDDDAGEDEAEHSADEE